MPLGGRLPGERVNQKRNIKKSVRYFPLWRRSYLQERVIRKAGVF